MKAHRHRPGETAIAPSPGGDPTRVSAGIPLLLLPEGAVFDVDASLLMGPLSTQDVESGSCHGPEEGRRGTGEALVQGVGVLTGHDTGWTGT